MANAILHLARVDSDGGRLVCLRIDPSNMRHRSCYQHGNQDTRKWISVRTHNFKAIKFERRRLLALVVPERDTSVTSYYFTVTRITVNDCGLIVYANSPPGTVNCFSTGATFVGVSMLFSAFRSELSRTKAFPALPTLLAPTR